MRGTTPSRSPGPLLLALAALALLSAGPASAQGAAPDYGRSGAHVGLAGSFAIPTKVEDELEDAAEALFGPAASANVDPSLGLHARLGYRFHPHLAVEGHFEWLSEFDGDVSVPFTGNVNFDLEVWTLTGDAKVFLLAGSVQPFLVAGAGILTAEVEGTSIEETDFAARVGGGLDVYLNPHVSLGLDATYVIPTGDVEDLDYVSIGWGVQFRF